MLTIIYYINVNELLNPVFTNRWRHSANMLMSEYLFAPNVASSDRKVRLDAASPGICFMAEETSAC